MTQRMNAPRHPPELPVTYVDDTLRLEELCAALRDVERFGLDTEFVGERTYTPRLELIQIATGRGLALIDCQAVSRLDPLLDVLTDTRIEKVLHAGQQDLEIVYSLAGQVVSPIFDTQVAAAMVGYGAQPGYAHLVERLLGVVLEKTETLTDWTQRPLTRAQLAYAVDDVRHLLPLYAKLRARLNQLDRWEWLQEELRRIEQTSRVEPVEPEQAYLRVRGRGTLRAKGLAVLRALAAWRETLARERNKPRGTIIRDEALVEIARKAPTSVAALRGLRAVRSREIERQAEEIVTRVKEALDLPKEQWPKPPAAHGEPPPTGVIELLQALVRVRAGEAHIASNLIATSAELHALIERHAEGAPDLPVLQGWRRQIAGDELVALLEGKASVEIDPVTARVRVRRKE